MNINNKSKAIWCVVNENLNKSDRPTKPSHVPSNEGLNSDFFNTAFISNINSIVNSVPSSQYSVSHYLNKTLLKLTSSNVT